MPPRHDNRMTGLTMTTFEHIIVERKGKVGVIRLNRPKLLNALSFGVFQEIAAAVDELEGDDGIGCILIAGGEKAFAAGADIKEMQPKGFIDMFTCDFSAIGGERVAECRKPTIAAVSGYALGGGCELAMMCDIIIAADTAKFGQPEITLGTIPGIGGTQRLTRAIGKSKAMDLCLTGRMMDAAEAERAGLVSRDRAGRQADGRSAGGRRKRSPRCRSPRRRWRSRPSTAPSRPRSPRAWTSSATCSARPSRWTTAPRAWPRSSRSASRRTQEPLAAASTVAAVTFVNVRIDGPLASISF